MELISTICDTLIQLNTRRSGALNRFVVFFINYKSGKTYYKLSDIHILKEDRKIFVVPQNPL